VSPIVTRRHPRTQIYLPSRCTALLSRDRTIRLEGKADTVGRGGLRLLMPTLLTPPTQITVSIAGEEPLGAHVVWSGPTRRTDLGIVVPHGLRFLEEISEVVYAKLLAALREKAQVQRNPRLPLRLGVQVRLGESVRLATVLNLSVGGAFITTPSPPSAGEELYLLFSLPGTDRPLSLACQVVWQNGIRSSNGFQPGMGVVFTAAGTEEALALERFLGQMLPR
jgi:Tfp pilus assembly protein PilZ